MKSTNHSSTKQIILGATLSLIKEDGFKGVTIRKIAKLAGVNVALINYHFGSKENLINEAIQVLVTSLKDTFTILDLHSLPPNERIKKFLLQYLHTLRKYPFIGQRILQENTELFNSQLEYLEFLKVIGLKKFQNAIKEVTGEEDTKKLTIMTSQLIGAALLPALVEPHYENVMGYPFPDIETQIDVLMEKYLHD